MQQKINNPVVNHEILSVFTEMQQFLIRKEKADAIIKKNRKEAYKERIKNGRTCR